MSDDGRRVLRSVLGMLWLWCGRCSGGFGEEVLLLLLFGEECCGRKGAFLRFCWRFLGLVRYGLKGG